MDSAQKNETEIRKPSTQERPQFKRPTPGIRPNAPREMRQDHPHRERRRKKKRRDFRTPDVA
jgi:hypothetical protein